MKDANAKIADALKAFDEFEKKCAEAQYTDTEVAWTHLYEMANILRDLQPVLAGTGAERLFVLDAEQGIVRVITPDANCAGMDGHDIAEYYGVAHHDWMIASAPMLFE